MFELSVCAQGKQTAISGKAQLLEVDEDMWKKAQNRLGAGRNHLKYSFAISQFRLTLDLAFDNNQAGSVETLLFPQGNCDRPRGDRPFAYFRTSRYALARQA